VSTPVIERFHIVGGGRPRPAAERVAYADGAGAAEHRAGIDIELSHWVPNTTDPRYRADTSTEICLRYAARPSHDDVDLVVNDHVDVDGMLSVFALVHSDLAIAHADLLVAAASMGDFYAWADRAPFGLAQSLSVMMTEAAAVGADAEEMYARGLALTRAVLEGEHAESPRVAAGWSAIERGVTSIGSGEVAVTPVSERLTSFVYPASAAADLAAALAVPGLNAVVDDSVWLWPQVRNRTDAERVQLVSVPGDGGWFHDLWYPGYCWADTPGRWSVGGLRSTGDSNTWVVDHPPLDDALATLAARETATGRWVRARRLTPFSAVRGRAFPVVACFVDAGGAPAESGLPPDVVAEVLRPAW
jgi:hypothetical protein